MRFGSVCSGIEAASVAWGPLGWKAAWLSEIEAFPSAVLKHHYPDVPNLGDMTTLPARIASGEVEAPDLFCGGTPCQAFSVAGLRQSLGDARGNLSLTFCEISDAIDAVRLARGEPASIVFWENVPGVLSTKDNAFGCFLGALSGSDTAIVPSGRWTDAGVVAGPKRTVAWRTLDAQYFGVAQRRRRVFVVASARDDFDPAAVLLEWEGLRRDSAPSREAGKVAPTIPSRSTAGGGLGTDFDCDGGVIQQPIAQCLTTGTGQRYDPETETLLPCVFPTLEANDGKKWGSNQWVNQGKAIVQPVTHSLRGEGFDASEDGTGRGTPLIPVAMRESGQGYWMQDDVAGTLRAEGEDRPSRPSHVIGVPMAYAVRTANTSANGHGVAQEVSHTLDRAQGQAIAFHPTQDPISSTDGTTHAMGCGSSGGQASVAVALVGGVDYENNGHTSEEPTGPLLKGSPTGGGRPLPAIALAVAFTARDYGNDATTELAPTMRSLSKGADGHQSGSAGLAVAIGMDGDVMRDGLMETVTTREGSIADTSHAVAQPPVMQVRRLTPVECERLQGFPDNYTSIPWRGKPVDNCPDGPRYKALGNSWAVPVVRWIGSRIQDCLTIKI